MLQKKAADKIEEKHPIKFDGAKALEMEPANLHRTLVLIMHTQPELVLKGSQKKHLQLFLRAYSKADDEVALKANNEVLLEKLCALVKEQEGSGMLRSHVLRGQAPPPIGSPAKTPPRVPLMARSPGQVQMRQAMR